MKNLGEKDINRRGNWKKKNEKKKPSKSGRQNNQKKKNWKTKIEEAIREEYRKRI